MDLGNIKEGFKNAKKAKQGNLAEAIEEEAQRRLSICNECPTLNKALMWCSPFKGGCGCFVKKKVYSPKERCDNWDQKQTL